MVILIARTPVGCRGPWLTIEKAVHDLQVSNDGGATWANDLARQDYNFFQKSGGVGSGNVQIKAVSCDGDEVIIDNVEVTSENVVQACSNFP